MIMRVGRYIFFIGFLAISTGLMGQTFTRQDTLRGSITAERAWWDLVYYHLDITVNPADSTIKGSNLITYKVLSDVAAMQIDLQPPLIITAVEENGRALEFQRDGNAYFIHGLEKKAVGAIGAVKVMYEGKPRVSPNPPWSGGITWQRDEKGNPFVASSCQGDGASLWWPCKDHMYDEPDSMLISVAVPKGLMDVSNGQLRKVEKGKKFTTYHWFVDNPINNYGVNINIGDYVHFSETYDGENGPLLMDYYVLPKDEKAAREQFKEAPRMMKAFEYWFGPYPFYEDGFKLVQVPYLGMEHQSSVTYGNGFQNGYRGRDLSSSGWGMKFDFIIVHESGHEWFANNITYKDIADMWIHESFTAYSENLFLDYYFGKEAAGAYTRGTRMNIQNEEPIIGIYNVNHSGSGDMYYKGANMLHMIRQIVNDDSLWRDVLRGLNKEFYHETVTTQMIESYMINKTGQALSPVFDQYLRDIRVPVLEYARKGNTLYYRWNNTIRRFKMPVDVSVNGESVRLNVTNTWQTYEVSAPNFEFSVNPDYYISLMEIN